VIKSIALSTDFSEAGQAAFAHALRLAVSFKSGLDLLHVRDPDDRAEWDKFPRVRETLEKWKMLADGSEVSDIFDTLGVRVRKVDIRDADASEGLSRYLIDHRPDLLVMATHGRAGLNRWLSGSVSGDVATETDIPTLLFGPVSKAFVDPETGKLDLATVAMPVDHDPSPRRAIELTKTLIDGLDAGLTLFHIGADVPRVDYDLAVKSLEGEIVETIVSESAAVDLLVMPTAGRHGFLDAVRGSTTERVLRDALCPVLAVQAG